MAPLSRTFGRPDISVMTSISRWMPSGSTGRCAKRDPDHALITASLAAHRAAKCRAAEELLSAAFATLTGSEGFGEHRAGPVDLLGEVRDGDQIDPRPEQPPWRKRYRTYTSSSFSRDAGSSSIAASCRFSGASWLKRRSAGRSYIGRPPAIAEASRR